MIAFRIRFNNRKLATAGLPGHHVVSAIATSVARRPEVVRNARPRQIKARDLKFELGGLWTAPDGAQESVSWTNILTLAPGDKLSIEVVDTDEVDPPRYRSRMDAPSLETAEKTQLRQLTKKYGKNAAPSGTRHNKALQRTGRRPARR